MSRICSIRCDVTMPIVRDFLRDVFLDVAGSVDIERGTTLEATRTSRASVLVTVRVWWLNTRQMRSEKPPGANGLTLSSGRFALDLRTGVGKRKPREYCFGKRAIPDGGLHS